MSGGGTEASLMDSAGEYASYAWESVRECAGEAGELFAVWGGVLWLYMLEAVVIFSDPCTLIVLAFAILVNIFVRLLTASVRKGYSYMKTSKQSEGGEAPKISKMSNAGESMSMASEVASEPESELDGDGRPRSAPMTSAQNGN
ncbi:uncharacterized protein LOC142344328 [Convolutriloba macropyga]|uniref:uncharacterized protein LOC142344328 n=1 Tax=Convolutriloba macropyga TaxID=536237 RepID=UPI003F51BD98